MTSVLYRITCHHNGEKFIVEREIQTESGWERMDMYAVPSLQFQLKTLTYWKSRAQRLLDQPRISDL